jgi:hypothetical protein
MLYLMFVCFSTDMNKRDLLNDHTCNVYNTGLVHCIPQLTTKNYCVQNLKRWPFDEQKCKIVFISYSYGNDSIHLLFHHSDDAKVLY